MAKIIFVNSVCFGSTGKICKDLYRLAEKNGHTCLLAFGRGKAPEGYHTIKISNSFDFFSHLCLTRLFDGHGFGSKMVTKLFIRKIEEFKPDIIHLHNLHGYYINIQMLFDYLKKNPHIKVIWTLHDCWAITGHCAYYLYHNCNKWMSQCMDCQYSRSYPKSYFDHSKENYTRKKEMFSGINNMTIVVVSKWLSEQIQMSYLNLYPIEVIHNGLTIKGITWAENEKIKYRYLEDTHKKIILGVANVWEERKGLSDFMELSNKIGNDYSIVLVGVPEKNRINTSNIVYIDRTSSMQELYYLYHISYVYFNPTKEETFGMTNLEAQVVGTPVISYSSGGTPDSIINSNSMVIEPSVDAFLNVLNNRVLKKEDSININLFDAKKIYEQYMKLYEG